ncbi:MAG: hypothetical protein COB30_014930 [Ectothiorhodospiraceae bacterium]|nr:hypothetical protein [Ectothiorhodospiraceae bacterium]
MDISGVITPALPEVQAEPPRNAQLQAAVREPSQSEPQQNDTQSDANPSPRDEYSNVGQNIDERV